MERGDFDHTPAPSGRPSLSLLRSDEDGASPPSTSSATRTAGVRHHLLKTSASGPTIVDRDIPDPPALNQSLAASDAVPVAQVPTAELENKAYAPPRQSSAFSIASCPARGCERMAMSPVTPLSNRAALNRSPAHQEESPFRSHHPSHAKSAEFDGNGHSTTASRSAAPSTPRAHLQSSDNDTRVGEVRAQDAASSNGCRAVDVRLAVPDHYGHSHVSKIRPALEHYPIHHPVTFGDLHGPDIRVSHNKVGPFDPALECIIDSEHDEDRFVSESSTAVSLSGMRNYQRRESRTRSSHANSEAIGSSVGHVCHGNISKVQAAVDSLDVGLFDEEYLPPAIDSFAPGHSLEFSVSKVRPYLPSPDRANKVTQRPAYGSKVKPMAGSNPNRPGQPSRRDSAESIETPSPVRHDAMRFPVAKVKPCVDDSLNAVGPHEGHHHIQKAQRFTDGQPPSAFHSQAILDQCRRCQTPTRFGVHDSDETSKGSNAHLEQTNPSEQQPPGKHSISRCEEYPTYAGPKPHTIDMCQHLPPCSGQTQLGPDEVQSQDITPRPCQAGIKGNQAAGRIRSPDVTSSESSSNTPTQSEGFRVAEVYGVPHFRQEMETPIHFRKSQTPKPTQDFIHAPIPVSKVRPSFQDHSFSEHEGHSSVSKVKVAENGSLSASFRSDRFFDIECDSSQHGGSIDQSEASNGSGRNQSLGSVLDYRRTAQWLRDVLKHPETYTTRFTERPGKKSKDAKQASPEQRRRSESVLSSVLSARHRMSTRSAKSDSKFDGYGFKRAVSDLERLLNEALAIASQVADQPETHPRQRYNQPSISLHSHCHSLTSGSDEYSGSGDLTSPSAHESADDEEEIELDEVANPKRPACRHAATYSGLPRRPRLNEIIQSYSGNGEEIKKGAFVGNADEPRPTQTMPKVSFDIPHRTSSRNMVRYDVATTEGGQARASATMEGTQRRVQHDDVPRYPKEIVLQLSPEHKIRHDHGRTMRPNGAAGQHRAHGARRDQDEGEELPDRDIAGRPMHTEHGISLRRRSHVSLRGASGFSLAKSRKRQATARD
ncbi:Uncharacterized protein TCAP_07229 [Tolypocladium capitatum]|uniref:Uncharacterized protein n=1 Tax=Tolypocladium capitatum TaxID=45235 RepID=A0A2K3Q2G6_9HYPO|nr:Uncharacterized protein TCAP_07229 [Tolypocladium capitatum]